MNLIRFQIPELSKPSPFDGLSTFRDEINRLFGWTVPGFTSLGDRLVGVWSPPLDVFRNGDQVFVKTELPGVKKDEIKISLHENVLTLSGERKNEREVAEAAASYRSERFFGRFQRSVTLPVQVDPASVRAQYKDGVLTVTLSQAEEAKPRQIEVQVS